MAIAGCWMKYFGGPMGVVQHALVAWVIGLGAVSPALAARTIAITIPANSGKLKLTNPSSATVNYSVACFDMAGGAGSSFAGQTLAPNASTVHAVGSVDTGLCASNVAPLNNAVDATGKKYYNCGGSVPYASAGTLCGTGQSLCFPRPSAACSYFTVSACGQVWMLAEAGITYQSCGWVSIGTDKPFGGMYCSNLSIDAGTTYWVNTSLSATGAESKGAVCCENNVYVSVCKVTITNSGTTEFLSSPDFKGGASF